MNLLPQILPRNPEERWNRFQESLIREEAAIGGKLFGPLPKGHQRQFFCLDEHTWVWHEEWLDQNGRRQSVTTRYDVRPNGILKVQNGVYQRLSKEEVKNLVRSAKLYSKKVVAHHQQLLQAA